MRVLLAIGHRPHNINRKKYGAPYVAVYFANRRVFTRPGIYVSVMDKQARIIPLPKVKR